MLTGRCGCGAVTFSLAENPMFVNCCHCVDCQRSTGSAFVINAIVESKHLEISGETVETDMPSGSGLGQKITRCAACFVAIRSLYALRGPAFTYLRVGTLDDPSVCPPNAHIFTESKQPWVSLSGDIPVFEKLYDFDAMWPQASLARRDALMAGSTS